MGLESFGLSGSPPKKTVVKKKTSTAQAAINASKADKPVSDEKPPEKPMVERIAQCNDGDVLEGFAEDMHVDITDLSITEAKAKLLDAAKTIDDRHKGSLQDIGYEKWAYTCPCRKSNPYKKIKIAKGNPPMEFCRYCNSPMDAKRVK